MKRTLILILGAALFGIFAAVVFASQGSDDPAGTTTAETVTDTVERTTTVEVPRPERRQAPAAPQAQGGVDISGPCDEAEHANDPRCTGAAVGRVDDDDDDDRVDNSGPGGFNSGHDDDDDFDEADDFDDHGGNSGPGGGGDDDSSGHGGGDDD
jgi:hypothetical protein